MNAIISLCQLCLCICLPLYCTILLITRLYNSILTNTAYLTYNDNMTAFKKCLQYCLLPTVFIFGFVIYKIICINLQPLLSLNVYHVGAISSSCTTYQPALQPKYSASRLSGCVALNFSTTPLPLTALASVKGAGNTWTRHLIQEITGTFNIRVQSIPSHSLLV